MCNTVIAPAQIDHESSIKARIVAEKAIASFDGAGVFGVELFLLPNGYFQLQFQFLLYFLFFYIFFIFYFFILFFYFIFILFLFYCF
jgi:hypothetical protein